MMNTKSTLFWAGLVLVALLSGCGETSMPFYSMRTEEVPPPDGYIPGNALNAGIRLSSYEKMYVTNFNVPVAWDLSDMISLDKGPFVFKSIDWVGESHGQMTVADARALKGTYSPQFNFRGRERMDIEITDAKSNRHQVRVTVLVQSLVHELQPALAIRATGCIMCHSRVESNIVTDFGWGLNQNGTDLFFGRNTTGVAPTNGSIYGNHAENWAAANVTGKVFVPKAILPSGTPGANGTRTLADYLKGVIPAVMQNGVVSSTPGVPSIPPQVEVKQVDTVKITAPTQERIRELGGWNRDYAGLDMRFFPQDAGVSPELSGLRVAASGLYYENIPDEEIVCDGDVVINGVLFLKDAKIRTTDAGCRMYVSQSVFVTNSFTFPGTAVQRNLQISSARAIVLGVGKGYLSERMKTHWTAPGFHTTDASGTTMEKNARIYEESLLNPAYTDAATHGRDKSFERVLFNAPQFHSRYLGEVNAVIIAEVGLAALGNFKFHFASPFASTHVLPLLEPEEYLSF